jgi:riboflavin kinase/FMN adenylyltransferase
MDETQRRAAMLEAGADEVVFLDPVPEVLSQTARQFVERIVQEHGPVAWVEGADFRFGAGRSGDIDLLRALGLEMGFELEVVESVVTTLADQTRVPVSSTLVRWLIAGGRMADAAICLGRPFAMRGPVVQGEQRGRTIGFPTANIDTGDRILPADGVYAATVHLAGSTFAAAVSIGEKPTFGKRQRTFEAFILDHTSDLYGQTLEFKLLRWMRDQAIYPDVHALIDQMNRDVARVRRWHELGRLAPAILQSSGASLTL